MTSIPATSTLHPAAPARARIVFAHANSFPAGTYRVLFEALRERGYALWAPEKLGHDPAYPVSDNWPHLVQQLADFVLQQVAAPGSGTAAAPPLYLVGHSLGGYLSLMCAARHPRLGGQGLAGVVLLDAPLLGGWRARALQAAKRTRLIGAVSPGQVSRKRRQSWPDAEAALAHFAHKPTFARWDARVLRDYVAHGTHEVACPDGSSKRVLSFEREIETRIYDTLPHQLEALLRRHPLACPLAYIGGSDSVEMRQVGMDLTQRLLGPQPGARLQMLDGGHLFPMEQPAATAAALERALLALSAQGAFNASNPPTPARR
ncbi:MAG: alpha/beta fold hydrolase [Pseudomonadota bacterium]|jgi:pimeloyl-ACP methyl ester carboxylesterase